MEVVRTESAGRSRRSLLRQERSRETRRRLVHAARMLWSKESFEATTIEQLCAEAGVKRATFYLHFDSKGALLEELAWATSSSLAIQVDNNDAGSIDADVDAFIDGLVTRMHAVPKALAALVLDRVAGGLPPEHLPADRVVFDDILRELVARGQRRGDVVASEDAAELGAILGAMTMDALQRWSRATPPSRRTSLEQMLRVRFRVVLQGIRVPATREEPGRGGRR